jgi:hypothetical protein
MNITETELSTQGYKKLSDLKIVKEEERLFKLLNVHTDLYATDASSEQIAKALDASIQKALGGTESDLVKLREQNPTGTLYVGEIIDAFDVLNEINKEQNIEILKKNQDNKWSLIDPTDIINE